MYVSTYILHAANANERVYLTDDLIKVNIGLYSYDTMYIQSLTSYAGTLET